MRPSHNLTFELRLQRILISVEKIENLLNNLKELRKRISFQDYFASSIDLRISKLLTLRNSLIDIVSSNSDYQNTLLSNQLTTSFKALAKDNLIDFQCIDDLKQDVIKIDKNLIDELRDLKVNAEGFSNLPYAVNTFIHFLKHIEEVNKNDLHPINLNRIAYEMPNLGIR